MADEDIQGVSGSNMPRQLEEQEPKLHDIPKTQRRKEEEQKKQKKKDKKGKRESGNDPNLGRSVDVDG